MLEARVSENALAHKNARFVFAALFCSQCHKEKHFQCNSNLIMSINEVENNVTILNSIINGKQYKNSLLKAINIHKRAFIKRFVNWINSMLIPGKDDGKVSVNRSKTQGIKDHRVIHATHPWIMKNRTAMTETIHFLRHGEFRRPS